MFHSRGQCRTVQLEVSETSEASWLVMRARFHRSRQELLSAAGDSW